MANVMADEAQQRVLMASCNNWIVEESVERLLKGCNIDVKHVICYVNQFGVHLID